MPVVIYGIDDGNNKIETMTKEQILDAIAQAQEGHSVFDYDDAFISKIKEINHGNQLRFWIGTQAEYNEIDPKENNLLYIISDDNSKEEILEAVENLAESISGVDAALANKQDVLTFDTAPTQNSTNPVTSGGIYTAINNAKVTRTQLWKWDGQQSTKMQTAGDSATLSQAASNFDYIEIVTDGDHHYFYSTSTSVFIKRINNSTTTLVDDGTTGLVTNTDIVLEFTGNNVVVTDACYCRTYYYPTSMTSTINTIFSGWIQSIFGIKLSS